MARREVTADDVKNSGFIKFSEAFPEVGSVFQGIYQEDSEGTYGQDFKFKLKTGEIKTLTLKGPVKAQLLKAKPQPGELVTIKRGPDSVTDKGTFWAFKVTVDDAPTVKAKPAPVAAAEW